MRKGLHYWIERAIVLDMDTTKQTSKKEEKMLCHRCGHPVANNDNPDSDPSLCEYCLDAEESPGSACDESCAFCGRCS